MEENDKKIENHTQPLKAAQTQLHINNRVEKLKYNHLKAAQTQLHINKFLALNGKDGKENSHRVVKLKYNNTPIKNSP